MHACGCGSALVQSVNYAKLHSCLQASYFAPPVYALGFYFNRMQDVTGYRLNPIIEQS